MKVDDVIARRHLQSPCFQVKLGLENWGDYDYIVNIAYYPGGKHKSTTQNWQEANNGGHYQKNGVCQNLCQYLRYFVFKVI